MILMADCAVRYADMDRQTPGYSLTRIRCQPIRQTGDAGRRGMWLIHFPIMSSVFIRGFLL